MRLTFTVEGDVQIDRELTRMGERVVDAEPAFEEITRKIQEDIAQNFESEGESGGEPWQPLAASTMEAKARKGQDGGILRATDALFNALTGETGDTIKKVDPGGFELGASLFYLVFHQSKEPRTKLPRRAPIQFTELQRRGYVKILQRYIMEGAV